MQENKKEIFMLYSTVRDVNFLVLNFSKNILY